MRMLLPDRSEDLSPADLAAAYPWPEAPWLRVNMVTSADGHATGPDHRSGGISRPSDRALMHVLRAGCDAVLVGAGTVRAEHYRAPRRDDAVAAERLSQGRAPTHRIAVVSRSGRLDPLLPVVAEASDDARPLLLTTRAAIDSGAPTDLADRVEVVACGDDAVDLPSALAALRARDLVRVLGEGGPSLLRDLLAADLVDELDLTWSPVLVGGGGPRIVEGPLLPDAPVGMRVVQVLEDDGMLALRLLRG